MMLAWRAITCAARRCSCASAAPRASSSAEAWIEASGLRS